MSAVCSQARSVGVGSNAERGASFLRQMVQGAPQAKFKPRGRATRPMRQEPAAPASPSRGPGNGILRAETGGRIQAQNAGEQSEFGSQTTLRLTNPPELRGVSVYPETAPVCRDCIELMAIAAWHPFKTRRRVADLVRETICRSECQSRSRATRRR